MRIRLRPETARRRGYNYFIDCSRALFASASERTAVKVSKAAIVVQSPVELVRRDGVGEDFAALAKYARIRAGCRTSLDNHGAIANRDNERRILIGLTFHRIFNNAREGTFARVTASVSAADVGIARKISERDRAQPLRGRSRCGQFVIGLPMPGSRPGGGGGLFATSRNAKEMPTVSIIDGILPLSLPLVSRSLDRFPSFVRSARIGTNDCNTSNEPRSRRVDFRSTCRNRNSRCSKPCARLHNAITYAQDRCPITLCGNGFRPAIRIYPAWKLIAERRVFYVSPCTLARGNR